MLKFYIIEESYQAIIGKDDNVLKTVFLEGNQQGVEWEEAISLPNYIDDGRPLVRLLPGQRYYALEDFEEVVYIKGKVFRKGDTEFDTHDGNPMDKRLLLIDRAKLRVVSTEE